MMWEKIKAYIIQHRVMITAIGTPIVVIAILMALPIMTVPVQVTESYWDTEIKTEPYTTTETYTDQEAYTAQQMQSETVLNEQASYGSYSRSFTVNQAGATVSIDLSSSGTPYYYAPRYYIISDNYSPYYRPWGGGGYYPWSGGGYWYGPGWDSGYYGGGYGGQPWITVRISYPQNVTQYRPVTKTREVTKYREVPTQVRKERTVTQYVKMSVWQAMFR